jgi:hypothetical protein
MNAYLLHKLSEDEREALEDRWVEDSALYEQLRNAEVDLLDAYARGTLSPADRERVSKYLLDSPLQRRKLLFARALRNTFPAQARPTTPWLMVASAAVIVLLAGSVAWLAWQNAAMRREIAGAHAPRPSSASVIGSLYVAEVRMDTTRGTAASITQVRLPAGSQMLRLDLEIAPGYEAQVLTASIARAGRAVWSEEPIRAERREFGFVAPVWVPAAALAPGEYEIKLSSGGALVDYYRFHLIAAQ